MMPTPSPFIADEFKALRDEIKRCESESLSVSLFVVTATVLTAGLADKGWLPKPAFPALLQMILLWGMHRFYNLVMIRTKISAYIQVVLEPNMPGLRWEGLQEVFHFTIRRRRPALILLTLVAIIISGLSVYNTPTSDPFFIWYTEALGLLSLLTVTVMIKCVFFVYDPTKQIAAWREVIRIDQPSNESPNFGQSSVSMLSQDDPPDFHEQTKLNDKAEDVRS
jgi:hypothetical protein